MCAGMWLEEGGGSFEPCLHQDNICQPPGIQCLAMSLRTKVSHPWGLCLWPGAEEPPVYLWPHSVSGFLTGGAWRDRTTRTGEWPSSWVRVTGSQAGLALP